MGIKSILQSVYGTGRKLAEMVDKKVPSKDKSVKKVLTGFVTAAVGATIASYVGVNFALSGALAIVMAPVSVLPLAAVLIGIGVAGAAYGLGLADGGMKMLTGKAAFYPGYETAMAEKKTAELGKMPVASPEVIGLKYLGQTIDPAQKDADPVLSCMKQDAEKFGYKLSVVFSDAVQGAQGKIVEKEVVAKVNDQNKIWNISVNRPV